MGELVNAVNHQVILVNVDDEAVEKLRTMSVKDIDNYGADIQQTMTDTSKSILNKTNMLDLGNTKDELNELYDISNKHKRLMVPIIGKPLRKLRDLTRNYAKIQDRLDGISDAIESQKSRIDEYVGYMEEQIDNLEFILGDLRVCEANLDTYVRELDGEQNTDQTRVQIVATRLRNINTTRVIAEQAQAEAMMILAEQRESRRQLDEVIKNAIPALQIQAVNSVGIRVNKETSEIIGKAREITSNIVIQNATEVRNMAEELQKNRTKSIVDDDKLMEAQHILEEALKSVTEASKLEAGSNLRMIRDLQEKTKSNQESLGMLKNKLGESNKVASL